MARNKKEDLHKRLMTWAIEEMKFQTTAQSSSHNFQLPSEQDFKSLCQKPLDDVWIYVLKYVKSVQTVRLVKGNLALKRFLDAQRIYKPQLGDSVQEEEEKEKLQRSRSLIAKELTSCLSDVCYLEKEMKQVSKEVMETALIYQSVCQRVRDLQKKDGLLEAAGRFSEEKIAVLAKYTEIVTLRTKELAKQDDLSAQDFVIGGQSNKTDILETESQRHVRATGQNISHFLHNMFDGAFSSDKAALKKAEIELWKSVEKLRTSLSVTTIISSLITNTERAAKNLREETFALNIAKDVQTLSFSYGNASGLRDISKPPSVEKSVRQLLEASNLQHVIRWFKEQEHKNDEWKLTVKLEDLLAEVHKHVHRVMGEHPRNVPLAKGYVDALIQLAVERAVAPCLRAEIDRLVECIQKAKQEKHELHLKYQKIQVFRKIVEKNQLIIATLANQNSTASVRLDMQRKQVLSYIASRGIESHVNEVQVLTTDLKGSLIAEAQKFLSLVLPCLLVVSLDSNTRLCVLDLSISPAIYSTAREKLWVYSSVCAALDFPEFKSTDSLPLFLLEQHCNLQVLSASQCNRDLMVNAALSAAKTADISSFIDLCRKVEQHDKAQCDKYVPQLEKSIAKISASIKELENLKNAIHSWWEQPAKHATPWVIEQGKTFEQWMEKWRVAVNQMNKHLELKKDWLHKSSLK
ncbi:unnamed protein product [Lymnaea stagnalis]|uniref:HAUS augmin-like complex subunit 5 n=1 Tax=Lymnaea stagnalis TaxID=6523 RepID=A0AAV2I889_LYMST